MSFKSKPKVAELLSTNVTTRTKWDRSANKKLSKKAYVARLIYLDESGKRRERTKEFSKRRDAEDYLRQERIKYERSGGRELDAETMTFDDLADHYAEHYAKPAEYADGRKIAGLRSLAPVMGYIQTLRDEFGSIRLNKMTYGLLRDFKARRLRTLVVKKIKVKTPLSPEERKELRTRRRNRITYEEVRTPRKPATVNRELATLRHILSIAEMEGWIPKNPFKSGPGLIQASAETVRQRILSVEEEERLLAVCDCEERHLLRSLIICLLDTGMRLSEALTLRWDHVSFEEQVVNIDAFNTKTAQPKTVAVTARLKGELLRLKEECIFLHQKLDPETADLVFRTKSNMNRSWRTARALAKLEDVRLHDLRHTFGTRLNQLGLSQASIARALGHQQLSTTYRYINADKQLVDDVRSAIDSLNK